MAVVVLVVVVGWLEMVDKCDDAAGEGNQRHGPLTDMVFLLDITPCVHSSRLGRIKQKRGIIVRRRKRRGRGREREKGR